MENWPAASEFSMMLQNPQIAFADADLKTCHIARNSKNQPDGRSGAFAVAYKGTYQSGARAGENVCVRVFVKRSDERRERYAMIREYTRNRQIKGLVSFDYHEKGIRAKSDGKLEWWPLVTMDWVEGTVLFDWCRARCQQRDQQSLRNVAERWVELLDELAAHEIGHGDLQHANVLITPQGEPKLVDYDCMFVPALRGRRNLEIGVEPYQPRLRDETTELFSGIDNFSALYIYVVLQALSAQPDLWQKYIEPPNGPPYDKLLFRRTDFELPDQSELCVELKNSPEPKVRKLVGRLVELYGLPLHQIPPLAQLASDFDRIRELLRNGDYDEAIELATRGSIAPPPDLAAPLSEARACVEAYSQLQQAIEKADELGMAQWAHSTVLARWPRARDELEFARRAPQVLEALRTLSDIQQAGDYRRLVRTWRPYSSLLSSRPSARAMQDYVTWWDEQNRLCDEVLELIHAPLTERSCKGLSAVWDELNARGGHPDCATLAPRIQQTVDAWSALQRVRSIQLPPGEARDQALVAGWDEPLLSRIPGIDAERRESEAATLRCQVCTVLRARLRASPQRSVDTEQEVIRLARQLPSGYAVSSDVKALVESTLTRLKLWQELREIARKQPLREQDLGRAWQDLCRADGRTLFDATRQGRLDLAAERGPLLEQIQQVSLEQGLAERDARLLALWTADHDRLLKDCPAASAWLTAHAEAVQRRHMLAEREAAINAGDDARVFDLLTDPLLQGWSFDAWQTRQNQEARQRVGNLKLLLESVQGFRPDRFAELFSEQLVRRYSHHFSACREALIRCLTETVLPRSRCGLGPPRVGPAFQPIERPDCASVRLNWTWPAPRFGDRCILLICPRIPPNSLDEEALSGNQVALYRQPITRRQWETGGGSVQLPVRPEWKGKYVAVSALIDLDWKKFYSEPLVLGRIP